MSERLAGKTALITGSTSNIGRAMAVAFGAEGAHVAVSGRSAERGAAVVAQIRAVGGRADFVAADLDGSPAASRRLAEEAGRVLGGRIDVLVNNAGIFPGGATAATDEAVFDRVYAVNVKAPFFLTAVIAPGPRAEPAVSERADSGQQAWLPGVERTARTASAAGLLANAATVAGRNGPPGRPGGDAVARVTGPMTGRFVQVKG